MCICFFESDYSKMKNNPTLSFLGSIVWCKKMDTHLLLYTVANVYPFFWIRRYPLQWIQRTDHKYANCTPGPWLLRISVVFFSNIIFTTIVKNFFTHVHFIYFTNSWMQIWVLHIFARLKKRTCQGPGLCYSKMQWEIPQLLFFFW